MDYYDLRGFVLTKNFLKDKICVLRVCDVMFASVLGTQEDRLDLFTVFYLMFSHCAEGLKSLVERWRHVELKDNNQNFCGDAAKVKLDICFEFKITSNYWPALTCKRPWVFAWCTSQGNFKGFPYIENGTAGNASDLILELFCVSCLWQRASLPRHVFNLFADLEQHHTVNSVVISWLKDYVFDECELTVCDNNDDDSPQMYEMVCIEDIKTITNEFVAGALEIVLTKCTTKNTIFERNYTHIPSEYDQNILHSTGPWSQYVERWLPDYLFGANTCLQGVNIDDIMRIRICDLHSIGQKQVQQHENQHLFSCNVLITFHPRYVSMFVARNATIFTNTNNNQNLWLNHESCRFPHTPNAIISEIDNNTTITAQRNAYKEEEYIQSSSPQTIIPLVEKLSNIQRLVFNHIQQALTQPLATCFGGIIESAYKHHRVVDDDNDEQKKGYFVYHNTPPRTVSLDDDDSKKQNVLKEVTWKEIMNWRTAVACIPAGTGRKFLNLVIALVYGPSIIITTSKHTRLAYWREICKHIPISLHEQLWIMTYDELLLLTTKPENSVLKQQLRTAIYDNPTEKNLNVCLHNELLRCCANQIIICYSLALETRFFDFYYPNIVIPLGRIDKIAKLFLFPQEEEHKIAESANKTQEKIRKTIGFYDRFFLERCCVMINAIYNPGNIHIHYVDNHHHHQEQEEKEAALMANTLVGFQPYSRSFRIFQQICHLNSELITLADAETNIKKLMCTVSSSTLKKWVLFTADDIFSQKDIDVCFVCLLELHDPVQLVSCKHILCLHCLITLLESKCNPICPCCRTPFGPQQPFLVAAASSSSSTSTKNTISLVRVTPKPISILISSPSRQETSGTTKKRFREEEEEEEDVVLQSSSKTNFLQHFLQHQFSDGSDCSHHRRALLVLSCNQINILDHSKNTSRKKIICANFEYALSIDMKDDIDSIVVAHFNFPNDFYTLYILLQRAHTYNKPIHLLCKQDGADEFVLQNVARGTDLLISSSGNNAPFYKFKSLRVFDAFRMFALLNAPQTNMQLITKLVRCLLLWMRMESYLRNKLFPIRVNYEAVLLSEEDNSSNEQKKLTEIDFCLLPLVYLACRFDATAECITIREHEDGEISWRLYLSDCTARFIDHSKCFPLQNIRAVKWYDIQTAPLKTLLPFSRFPTITPLWKVYKKEIFGEFL